MVLEKSCVLLIEDNPDDERLALMALRKAENSRPVHVARDGKEAIDEIDSTLPADIALVLLDLKLPMVNGLQVLEHIHEAYPLNCPPVVVFTSSDEPGDIARSEDLGANQFISKPVDYDEYVSTMRSITDRWLR